MAQVYDRAEAGILGGCAVFGSGGFNGGADWKFGGAECVAYTLPRSKQADVQHVAILCPCLHHVRKEGYSKTDPWYHLNVICIIMTAQIRRMSSYFGAVLSPSYTHG